MHGRSFFNLKGVHIRFRPEGVSEDNITSRVFKKQIAFAQAAPGIFDMKNRPKKIVDGELVDDGNDDDGEG